MFLSASSNTETIHIFKLERKEDKWVFFRVVSSMKAEFYKYNQKQKCPGPETNFTTFSDPPRRLMDGVGMLRTPSSHLRHICRVKLQRFSTSGEHLPLPNCLILVCEPSVPSAQYRKCPIYWRVVKMDSSMFSPSILPREGTADSSKLIGLFQWISLDSSFSYNSFQYIFNGFCWDFWHMETKRICHWQGLWDDQVH